MNVVPIDRPHVRWTPDELEHAVKIAREHKVTNQVIAACLPGRSLAAVKHKLRLALGRRGKTPWSDNQLTILPRLLAELQVTKTTNWDEIGRIIGKTGEACRFKARELGLLTRPHHSHWTPKDEDYLRHHYGRIPTEHFVRRFKRSKLSILVKAHRLGLAEPRSS